MSSSRSPAAWIWLFVATIVFAVFYVPYHHFYLGWSAASQYQAEVAAAEAQTAVLQASLPQTNPYAGDAEAIAEGQQTFATICAACRKCLVMRISVRPRCIHTLIFSIWPRYTIKLTPGRANGILSKYSK